MKNQIINVEKYFDGFKWQGSCRLVIEDGKILAIEKAKAGKAGGTLLATPAFIDAHSHIGMFREGEPGSEQEGNEVLNQILPLSDPLNGIYFDDRAFSDAVDFGVLYSCVMPGSGNLFGGRSKVIRNYATNRRDATVLDYGYKMALGFNPRSTQNWKGDRPNTRMGAYGLLEKKFDEILLKRKKAQTARHRKIVELKGKKDLTATTKKDITSLIEEEFNNEFSREDLAILEVLDGKKIVKVHVHKEDDVYYLIDLADRYNLKVTAEHTGDVFHKEVFVALAAAKIPIVYGPLGSLAYKVELLHAYYTNTKTLMESGAYFGLMTDHPVIMSHGLRDCLKFFLIFGMPEEEALSLITARNAKILTLENRLGVIKEGAIASLLLWDRDPLHLSAMPKVVMAEGRLLRGQL